MAEYTGTFETGVNGNNLSTGDAGSATPWDFVTLAGTTTLTYSNVQKYESLSCRLLTDSTPNIGFFGWDASTLGTSMTTTYGRMYMWLPSSLDFLRCVVGIYEPTVDTAWDIRIDGSNKVTVRDTGGTVRGTSTTSVALNQWIRLEWNAINHTTAGFIECKLFNDPDSSTPTETITSTGSFSTLTRTDQMRFGNSQSLASSATYYFDNVVVNDTGYPGPFSSGGPAVAWITA